MRLTSRQIEIIKAALQQVDPEAGIKLFGSRLDDALRGGDIDLLIDSNTMGWREIAKLRGLLYEQLGEQKIDLVIKGSAEPSFLQMIEPTAQSL